MTKAQRRAKARRTGAKRRKANAAKAFLKRMNPAMKLKNFTGVKIKRLKGGGFSAIPVRKKKGAK